MRCIGVFYSKPFENFIAPHTTEYRYISDIQSLTDSPFQFSYADDQENLIERFKQWLENVILAGLDYWNNIAVIA